MATIHTLVPSVNNLLCLYNETGNSFWCYSASDALARRRSFDAKKKCGDCDYFSGCGTRDLAVVRSWRLCAATELRIVQERYSKSINSPNQTPVIEIPVTCYQVNALEICLNLLCCLFDLFLLLNRDFFFYDYANAFCFWWVY